ncbi:MAG: VWA domain-containing protein [Bryobacteraceae bacterium]|nr:VWA domain-containing protein [Bryobacteraceae bacterium]
MGSIDRRTLMAALPAGLLQEPVFRVDVRLVRILATVRDAQGALAGGLDRADFRVTDNGVEQEIAVFERQSAQPLSIAVLIDRSRSTQRERAYELDALRRFFRAVVREGNPRDAAALYSFNFEVVMQAGFTRRIERLEDAIRRLRSEGATAMYDAIYLAARDLEAREGRRVMVVVTDGADTISRATFHDALEGLHRADAVLYALLLVPVKGEAGRNLRGENALIQLSTGTGGRMFYPSEAASLDQAFSEILRDLRTQYLIGYYPKNIPPSKDRFHRIRVEVNRPGYTVSARTGYFADALP